MTVREACSIIGVNENAPIKEIKTKYRKLMHTYHPDADGGMAATDEKAGKAILINEAYNVLLKKRDSFKPFNESTKENETPAKEYTNWKAPLNDSAYAPREILQPVEDSMGNTLANICVAKGKYLWTEDEEFKLFLLSIYNLSKSILDKVDDRIRRNEPVNKTAYQAELAYILARQYINGEQALKMIAGEGTRGESGDILYLLKGMLEKKPGTRRLSLSEFLYPEKVSNHRLYLKDAAGKSLGYLSFKDDRLYYVVVPLFEARKVKVMIMQNHESTGRDKNTDLLVWIKLIGNPRNAIELDDNIKIKRLIEMYESE